MLENQLWAIYAKELYLEWMQARDEGKDVMAYEEICKSISDTAMREDRLVDSTHELALAVRRKLLEAPVLENYSYVEPSDLAGIRECKPSRRHHFQPLVMDTMDEAAVKDKLAGAWIGRISGCLLGKPLEIMMSEPIDVVLKGTNNYPLHRYLMYSELTDLVKDQIAYDKRESWQNCWADTIGGTAPIDDDTNYTVFAMKLLENYGKDFRPNDVLEAWLCWLPMFSTCTAERIAYRNAASGLYAPETATYLNPYREWIGAQIRGDFFGYVNMGNTELAAEMAWRDASISHVKNGIYGEMFVAAMIAAAGVCDDVMTVVEAGLDEIPLASRLRRDIEKVITWYNEGCSETEIIKHIHETYNEKVWHGWCHTNANTMVVVMALLYGKKDFGKSICLAVQAAFDTDCNGATVGSIVGMLVGAQKIPAYWYEIYNQRLSTSIMGYNMVTVPQLVEQTLCVMRKIN